MSHSAHSTAISADSAAEIRVARQADYVAFLHRVPFAIDALNLGYVSGFREDCTYQHSQYETLELPVGMLDNDFRNPDLKRYIDRFREYEPRVGVLGDAYSIDEAREYVRAARDLQASYPESELVIVPKCYEAIDAIPEDLMLGYPRGYSDQLAHEFSDPADWRGRRVHILGGSPRKQMGAIGALTRPTLSGDPPAEIVGLDWNGLHRGAQFGEFWSADGWDDSGRDADHVTVRKLVHHSLGRIKGFWQAQGIWPETRLHDENITLEYEGPMPSDLSNAACEACGANVWTTGRGPFVAEYDTGETCGYCSYDCYFEHRTQNRLEELCGEQSVSFPV